MQFLVKQLMHFSLVGYFRAHDAANTIGHAKHAIADLSADFKVHLFHDLDADEFPGHLPVP